MEVLSAFRVSSVVSISADLRVNHEDHQGHKGINAVTKNAVRLVSAMCFVGMAVFVGFVSFVAGKSCQLYS